MNSAGYFGQNEQDLSSMLGGGFKRDQTNLGRNKAVGGGYRHQMQQPYGGWQAAPPPARGAPGGARGQFGHH